MKFILIGPPGSGKGTMTKMLQEKYNLKSFAVGDILRAEIKKETELGKLAAFYIDKGNFVPNEVSGGIIKNALKDCSDNYILDGYPRNIIQAQILIEILKDLGTEIDAVLHFKINDKNVIERLRDRMICSNCGAIYHNINLPSKVKNICDDCGCTLERRKDDAFIKRRLRIYHKETAPLLEYYSGKVKIINIKSNCSIAEQFENIERNIKVLK